MHLANINFFIYASGRHPRYFNSGRVVEIGSGNVNGGIRPLFDVEEYIGVDWREAKGVDVVSLAHNVSFPAESFDAVVSASMLEHDPHWKQTLHKMADLMKPDGVLILSWGCYGNPRHSAPEAPDYAEAKERNEHMKLHHARPVGDVLRVLGGRGLHIQELRYEEEYQFNKHLYKGFLIPVFKDSKLARPRGNDHRQWPLTARCVCNLIAFKDPALLVDPVIMTKLRKGDRT